MITNGANLVLHSGVVSGTWKTARDQLSITWFADAGNPPHAQIEAEVHRLAELVGVNPKFTVTVN